jgi:hypothetical protein
LARRHGVTVNRVEAVATLPNADHPPFDPNGMKAPIDGIAYEQSAEPGADQTCDKCAE